jgi:hypothetical protein
MFEVKDREREGDHALFTQCVGCSNTGPIGSPSRAALSRTWRSEGWANLLRRLGSGVRGIVAPAMACRGPDVIGCPALVKRNSWVQLVSCGTSFNRTTTRRPYHAFLHCPTTGARGCHPVLQESVKVGRSLVRDRILRRDPLAPSQLPPVPASLKLILPWARH